MKVENIKFCGMDPETFEPKVQITLTASIESYMDKRIDESTRSELDRVIGEDLRLAIEKYRCEK